jgi:hypothetical protein
VAGGEVPGNKGLKLLGEEGERRGYLYGHLHDLCAVLCTVPFSDIASFSGIDRFYRCSSDAVKGL